MSPWNNFADLLQHVASHYSNPRHLNYFANGQWQSLSTQQALQEIRHLALGLVSLGIKRGDCVGIVSLPSPRWTIANFATIMAGGIFVPIFPNIAEENFIFEIEQANIKTFFIHKSEPIPNFDRHRNFFENVIDLGGTSEDENAISYETLLKKGAALDKEQPDLYAQLEKMIKDDDLCTIVYTSGSTGTPKGVEHTQKSLIRHQYDKPLEVEPNEMRYLSLLPLAHIFGYTLNIIIFGWGGSIYYWNDPKNFADACKYVHPTLLVLVPRVLEKIYAKILASIQHAGFMKRQLGQWAFDLANDEKESFYKHLFHTIADKILYHTLRESLGGSIKTVISGGAALNPHLNHFFHEVGIPIVEGWGMTEACPVTVNRVETNKIGTVGPAISNFQYKISPEGEILIKGTGVMRGYYKNPEATAKAFDSDGWMRTGDKGEIDADGYLILHGRLKEMFKTSTGEYVVPVPIEQAICKAPLIDAAMVVADGRKFASALLFANKEVLESLKAAHSAQNLTDEEFLESDFVKQEMEKLFDNLNQHLNHWEQIHAYRFIPHPPSIEAGELTPSMKIRRDVVAKKYQHLIDAMYPEEARL